MSSPHAPHSPIALYSPTPAYPACARGLPHCVAKLPSWLSQSDQRLFSHQTMSSSASRFILSQTLKESYTLPSCKHPFSLVKTQATLLLLIQATGEPAGLSASTSSFSAAVHCGGGGGGTSLQPWAGSFPTQSSMLTSCSLIIFLF